MARLSSSSKEWQTVHGTSWTTPFPATITVGPDAAKAIIVSSEVWMGYVAAMWPVLASQIRSVPLSLDAATKWSSARNAAAFTVPVLARTAMGFPYRVSHTRVVLSSLTVRTRVPS